jgi:hydroxyethylthiazole kinase-like uncharacterized protein yjeF
MIELLTNAEMADADRRTIAGGVPGTQLMERAGAAVADAVRARFREGSRVVVVAGPGNNGGDGFVAARLLAGMSYRAEVLLLGDVARLKGDAASAAQTWLACSGEIATAEPAALAGADIIIDALFGAGLDRPVEGQARTMIDAMNASPVPIVAIDLPSGINGTSGMVMGEAVKASQTITFFRKKPGHVLLPGRLFCGSVSVADIGIADQVLTDIRPLAFENTPQLWARSLPRPQLSGHKYDRGHAVIASGPSWSTGAARLAARGALRAGAGLVTIASPRDSLSVNSATNLAIMVRPVDGAGELTHFLADPRLNAFAVGPGFGVGEDTCACVLAALAGERGVVLDADAITSFAREPQRLATALQRRGVAGQTTIMTPHEGEFSRFFGSLNEKAKVGTKLDRARLAAKLTNAIILLKGADTVVAAPDGRAAIAANAPAYLATAGAGDVLTGIVLGLVAQGMPGFEAAAAATWLHGEAALSFGPGLVSEDLPECLPRVYRALLA